MDQKEFNRQHPKLRKEQFNKKGFRKSLQKKFDHGLNMSRLRITNMDKEYISVSNSIIEELSTIFDNPHTFVNGNIYYIMTVISNHVDFINEQISKICVNGLSMETLTKLQTELIDQHKEIKEALFENISKPVTYDNLAEVLGETITDTTEVVSGEQKPINS